MSIASTPTLLGTDQLLSVVRQLTASNVCSLAYAPFGYHQPIYTVLATGFNGQLRDPALDGYLLGNGYRLFSPVLRRFYSPDSLSPFGEGGTNAYVYCMADPINYNDPSGHVPGLIKILMRPLGLFKPKGSTIGQVVRKKLKADLKILNHENDLLLHVVSSKNMAITHDIKINAAIKYKNNEATITQNRLLIKKTLDDTLLPEDISRLNARADTLATPSPLLFHNGGASTIPNVYVDFAQDGTLAPLRNIRTGSPILHYRRLVVQRV